MENNQIAVDKNTGGFLNLRLLTFSVKPVTQKS